MGKSKPPKVHRYSMHFKATAARLSDLPDVLIQDVAEALDIHPFMLSRWRKQAREGLIVTKGVKLDDETVTELKRLRDLEQKYKVLQQEHELLKKSHPVCFRSKSEIFEFIEANRESHTVALIRAEELYSFL
jgi:transposase